MVTWGPAHAGAAAAALWAAARAGTAATRPSNARDANIIIVGRYCPPSPRTFNGFVFGAAVGSKQLELGVSILTGEIQNVAVRVGEERQQNSSPPSGDNSPRRPVF
jgi:hypothetical protein